MYDLRKRFGLLLAANRRLRGLTQQQLADACDLSQDMIAQLEIGSTGARFPSIERIAEALQIDPAELFTPDLPNGVGRRPALTEVSARLAMLSDADLLWISSLIEAALAPRGRKA